MNEPLTETQVLDILQSIGCLVAAAAFVIQKSNEGDDIRHTLPSLIEAAQDMMQTLCLEYCAQPDPPSS